MKTLFLILTLFVSTLPAKAQYDFREEIKLHREIPRRGTGSQIEQNNTRHFFGKPIHAYQYDRTIIIVCNEAVLKDAKVSIINASTGAIVHSELYTETSTICIDLSAEPKGDYYMVIEYNGTELRGEFRIITI